MSQVVNIPIQNIYYLLCYAWDKLTEKEVVGVEAIDTTTLADLFARYSSTAPTTCSNAALTGATSRSTSGQVVCGVGFASRRQSAATPQ